MSRKTQPLREEIAPASASSVPVRPRSGVHASPPKGRQIEMWAVALRDALWALEWNQAPGPQGVPGEDPGWLQDALLRARQCRRLCERLLDGLRGKTAEPEMLDIVQIVQDMLAIVLHRLDARTHLLVDLPEQICVVMGGDALLKGCILGLLLDAVSELQPQQRPGGMLVVRGQNDEQIFFLEIETRWGADPANEQDASSHAESTRAQQERMLLLGAMVREYRGFLDADTTPWGKVVRLSLPLTPAVGSGSHSKPTIRFPALGSENREAIHEHPTKRPSGPSEE